MIDEELKHKSQYQLFTNKTCILFIMVSFLVTMAYMLPRTVGILSKTASNTSVVNSSINFSRPERLEKQSSSYYSIPMPCIEPHCNIECLFMYKSNEEDGIIRIESLTKIQQQHLMIDLGRDTIVEELINFIPPYKLCP